MFLEKKTSFKVVVTLIETTWQFAQTRSHWYYGKPGMFPYFPMPLHSNGVLCLQFQEGYSKRIFSNCSVFSAPRPVNKTWINLKEATYTSQPSKEIGEVSAVESYKQTFYSAEFKRTYSNYDLLILYGNQSVIVCCNAIVLNWKYNIFAFQCGSHCLAHGTTDADLHI